MPYYSSNAARHTPPSGDCPERRELVSQIVGKPEGSSNGCAANGFTLFRANAHPTAEQRGPVQPAR